MRKNRAKLVLLFVPRLQAVRFILLTQNWRSLFRRYFRLAACGRLRLTQKALQPAQIEQLMIDVGAYRETFLRIEIQETAKKNLLSYAPLDVIRHIGEPLGVEQLLADCAVTAIKFSIDEVLDFNLTISKRYSN